MTDPLPAPLTDRLRAHGLRLSRATRAAVALLAQPPRRVWRHATLQQALQAQGIVVDRVTLYRLLERLHAAGLVRCLAGDDPQQRARAWVWCDDGAHPALHAVWACDTCQRRLDLDELPEALQQAAHLWQAQLEALGHQGARLDLAWHGVCRDCAPTDSAPGATGHTAP
ncbi:hypothetical protein Tther_01174 [Tepidimonas thermarum]|uniref:Ferric uptake regulation protein n=1 Tax=Tepidimonas thermarum TaxID=335431 RepID=A0A554X2G7_9BURK|nr:hypothetical protein [Tepidimonas thermarum]TSE30040.1 hypothetical protein Tther_01174 [Tepidimonas thermarum]